MGTGMGTTKRQKRQWRQQRWDDGELPVFNVGDDEERTPVTDDEKDWLSNVQSRRI